MFGRREPAWRRNQENRARQEREAHQARRRERLGLAPVALPERGSGMSQFSFLTTDATTTLTTGSTYSAYADYMTAMQWSRSYGNGINDLNGVRRLAGMGNAATLGSRAGQGVVAVPAPERLVEREPNLREIWAD